MLVAACLAAASGCDDGSANRILMRKACLQYIHAGYDAFLDQNAAGPTDTDQLADFVKDLESPAMANVPKMIGDQGVADEAIARVREGEIVVIWGGKYPDEPSERLKYLLAFEARTPGSGGYLVRADGEVLHVTATEFSDYGELPH
tara:strand:+ start:2665 stop:3102 length:438 start_codon:yes stop_codon:yes gene_type:complete